MPGKVGSESALQGKKREVDQACLKTSRSGTDKRQLVLTALRDSTIPLGGEAIRYGELGVHWSSQTCQGESCEPKLLGWLEGCGRVAGRLWMSGTGVWQYHRKSCCIVNSPASAVLNAVECNPNELIAFV